jgi:hypothetical protein
LRASVLFRCGDYSRLNISTDKDIQLWTETEHDFYRDEYINPYYNITLPLYYLDESALTTSNYILRLFTQESLHGIRRHIVRFPRLATMRLQQRSARRLVGSGYFRDGIGKFAEFQVVLSGLASPTTGPAVPAHQ